jgi:hypothetical protein
MQNAALARVFGVQAGLELKLGGGFLFTTDYNFQRGTEELDNGNTSPSRHAPPAFGVTRLQYTDDRLTLQWYAQYSADRQFEALPFEEQGKPELYAIGADGRIYSPAWYTLNVKAMYLTTKYAVPFMRKAKGGSIVNISSVQSLANQKGVVAYAASKGAVNALTRAIAVDYAGEQIRCNAVLPGCVDTPMLRATAQSFKGERSEEDLLHEWGLSHPIGRMASIHDIGNLVGFLCSDKSAIITGASYVIDGGLITQVPVILPE